MIILLAILTRKWASEMQDPLKISWTNSNKRYQLLTCISDIWKVYQIPYSCIRNYSNKCTQKKNSMKLRISWGWKKAVQLSSKISTLLLFFSIKGGRRRRRLFAKRQHRRFWIEIFFKFKYFGFNKVEIWRENSIFCAFW